MKMQMLRGQPRDVIAKLNGMSDGEKHELFEKVMPEQYGEDGQPLYSVSECRERLQEIRREPVATVQAAAAQMMACQKEHYARDDEQAAFFREWFARFKEEFERNQGENRDTRGRIDGLWQAAVCNRPEEALGLSPDQVGKKAGWSGARVRRYANKKWFPKSLHRREKNKPMVFDPIKVLEDISDIKKRRVKL
jgi:hypothetical protein